MSKKAKRSVGWSESSAKRFDHKVFPPQLLMVAPLDDRRNLKDKRRSIPYARAMEVNPIPVANSPLKMHSI